MSALKRTKAFLRGLLFRDSTIFVIAVLVAVGFLGVSRAWITVPNPDYDPSAGRIENCGSGLDQFGNYDEGCWNTNEAEMQDESRLNVVIGAYIGALLLGPLVYKRLKPMISLESRRRQVRRDFLNGKVAATEMENDLERHRYFTMLEQWVEQGKIRYKHSIAAQEEWYRNPDKPHVWRYPASELRKMYDRGELTLEQFESRKEQNDDWFELPERIRRKYHEGLISEKEFQDTLHTAGYDHDKWWRAW